MNTSEIQRGTFAFVNWGIMGLYNELLMICNQSTVIETNPKLGSNIIASNGITMKWIFHWIWIVMESL